MVNATVAKTTVIKDSEGYFQLPIDHTGSGSAILRFLPALDDEELPFVVIYNHAFRTPDGRWFIDNCPMTISQDCPVCESNTDLGRGPDKGLASARKRKKNYVANVLVVANQGDSEQAGAVFRYKFGETIMGKIKNAIEPPYHEVEPVDIFDAEAGANLLLKVKKGSFPDYSNSFFDAPSAIGDQTVIAAILARRRSLSALLDPAQYKPYEELKRKFDKIVGLPKAA